jgi:hypothetical protein
MMHGDLASCSAVGQEMSAYVDGRLPEPEWQRMREHLQRCSKCARRARQVIQLRASLQSLPERRVPPELSLRMRVLASREAARRSRFVSFRATLGYLFERTQLLFHNLMRPLAVPAAGGLLSTLILFGMMLPNFTPLLPHGDDTPINDALFTEATVRSVLPVGFSGDYLRVDVLIDENGRMLTYSLPDGTALADPQLQRNLENTLLFTVYRPATAFGQPTGGWIRLTFRRTQMDVKG